MTAMHVLRITAGLSGDGVRVAMSAAIRPALEDLVPGVPPIVRRHPFLSSENGDEFMAAFHQAADGEHLRSASLSSAIRRFERCRSGNRE